MMMMKKPLPSKPDTHKDKTESVVARERFELSSEGQNPRSLSYLSDALAYSLNGDLHIIREPTSQYRVCMCTCVVSYTVLAISIHVHQHPYHISDTRIYLPHHHTELNAFPFEPVQHYIFENNLYNNACGRVNTTGVKETDIYYSWA